MWLKYPVGEDRKKHRLICCGHAGSTYVDFSGWRDKIDQSVEVVAVSLPGRCERIAEEPVKDLQYLAMCIAEQLCSLPPLPTTIFGHSFGGAMAYEVASKLQGMGYAHLNSIIVSACGLNRSTVLNGVDKSNEDAVLRAFKSRGYLNDEQIGNTKLMELVLPYLLSDILCKEGWQPDPQHLLDKPVHSFAWQEDALISPAEILKWSSKSAMPEKCTHTRFPGEHLEYLSGPDKMFSSLNRLILTSPAHGAEINCPERIS